MKMSAEHYAKLEQACKEVIDIDPKAAFRYANAGLTPKRYRWDVLHACRIDGERSYKFICDVLYPAGLNDEHIDTALRKIIKDNT